MASPRFRLGYGSASTGPWTYGSYDAPINVGSAAWVKVELESTAGVGSIAVSIPTADDTTLAAGVPTVTVDQLTRTAVFQCPAATQRSLNVQVTVNGGVGANGAADTSMTSVLQVNIPSTERSLRPLAVAENDEYSRSYGWAKKYNELVTAVEAIAGGGGPAAVATDAHTLAHLLFDNVDSGTGDLADTVTARGNWTPYASASSPQLAPSPFGYAMRNGAGTSEKRGFSHAATGWSPTSAITLSAWVYVANACVTGTIGRIIDKLAENGKWQSGSYDTCYLLCGSSTLNGAVYTDAGWAYVAATYAPYLVVGWHHVAFTYDLATAKLYVDGILLGSTSLAATALSWAADGDWFVGSVPVGGTFEQWPGGVDDVRIEDCARTQAEIVTAVRAGFGWTA